MTDTHETELEFGGELRLATVEYCRDDDAIEITKVVLRRAEQRYYNAHGDYHPRIERHVVTVTNLLSKAQIKALAMEITEALQEEMA